MTIPAQQPEPVDTSNALLAEVPAQWQTAIVEYAAGQRLAFTIRTASTTLTLLLARADAERLAADVATGARMLSAAGLIVPNGHIPAPAVPQ